MWVPGLIACAAKSPRPAIGDLCTQTRTFTASFLIMQLSGDAQSRPGENTTLQVEYATGDKKITARGDDAVLDRGPTVCAGCQLARAPPHGNSYTVVSP